MKFIVTIPKMWAHAVSTVAQLIEALRQPNIEMASGIEQSLKSVSISEGTVSASQTHPVTG